MIPNSEPSDNSNRVQASGTLAPKGKPSEPPSRIDAGRSCIVDLKQPYQIAGDLVGTMDIDYRIIVHGPCGSPIGTYDEEWISHGTIAGKIGDSTFSAKLTYVAHVIAGGEVSGKIVFGQGLEGELKVGGNFEDGKLSYEGWVSF